MQGNQT